MAREELWTRAAIVRTDGAGRLFLVLGTDVQELGLGLRLRLGKHGQVCLREENGAESMGRKSNCEVGSVFKTGRIPHNSQQMGLPIRSG